MLCGLQSVSIVNFFATRIIVSVAVRKFRAIVVRIAARKLRAIVVRITARKLRAIVGSLVVFNARGRAGDLVVSKSCADAAVGLFRICNSHAILRRLDFFKLVLSSSFCN